MHKKILLTVSVISTVSILFLSSLFSYLYDLDFYDKKYQQYNVYDRFSKDEALSATKNLFGFFKSENELDMGFFNEQERSHLYDVKILIQKAALLFYVSLVISLVIIITQYILNGKRVILLLSKIFIYTGIFTILLLSFFFLLYLFAGFDFLFIKFHEILFIGNYSFDPNVSNMKALFPDAFFFDISQAIIILTLFKSILLIAIGLLINRKLFKRKGYKP